MRLGPSAKVTAATCPSCGATLDGASAIDSHEKLTPKAGDLSVCFYCASILRYTAPDALEPLPPADLLALPEGEQAALIEAQYQVRRFRARMAG